MPATPTAPRPPRRFLRLPVVEDRTGLRRDSIYRLGREGKFPRPVKLSEHASGWLEDEIDGWIASRVAESRPTTNTETPEAASTSAP